MATERQFIPPTEVTPKPTRRTFTAQYKRRIVAEADRCQPGQVGALLRREGLYSSHLSDWRKELKQHDMQALGPKPRGPRGDDAQRRILQLERDNALLLARAQKAELLVEIQKKVSHLLGVQLSSDETEPGK